MDIFHNKELKELYLLLRIENKIVNNNNDDELNCENDIVIILLCFVCKLGTNQDNEISKSNLSKKTGIFKLL